MDLTPEQLLEISEPIMIVGNKNPDGDSVGSIIAVLSYLRNLGLEAYAYFVNAPTPSLAWMVDEDDTSDFILEDYESLVVLDDQVDSDRLGFQIKEDIEIVNIDHHVSNFLNKDLDYSKLTITENDKILHIQRDASSTASILIELGIYHKYLWCSIYTDTVKFTVNCVEAFSDVNKLIKNTDLTTPEIESYIASLEMKCPWRDLYGLPDTSFCIIRGDREGKTYTGLIVLSPDISYATYKSYIGLFRLFSSFLVFINRDTGQTSFRSDSFDFPVLPYATFFGGGGHIRACGCTLPLDNVRIQAERLVALISRDLTSISIDWIN